MTIPGQEWLDSLPNLRKQEPYYFILRALIEQLINSGQRTISIAELNMKKRIVFDKEIAGFAAMGTRQVTNHVKLASVLQTMRRQIRRKEEIYMQWIPGHSKHLGNEMADGWVGIPGFQGYQLLSRLDEDGFQKDSQESY